MSSNRKLLSIGLALLASHALAFFVGSETRSFAAEPSREGRGTADRLERARQPRADLGRYDLPTMQAAWDQLHGDRVPEDEERETLGMAMGALLGHWYDRDSETALEAYLTVVDYGLEDDVLRHSKIVDHENDPLKLLLLLKKKLGDRFFSTRHRGLVYRELAKRDWRMALELGTHPEVQYGVASLVIQSAQADELIEVVRAVEKSESSSMRINIGSVLAVRVAREESLDSVRSWIEKTSDHDLQLGILDGYTLALQMYMSRTQAFKTVGEMPGEHGTFLRASLARRLGIESAD